MSGSAFLEEIVSWDEEKRAERVEEALPRLIICLENRNSHDEAVGILELLCQSFVPVVRPEELEEKVFSKVSQQVCQLLDAVIEDLREAVRQDQTTDCDQLMAWLQHMASVVQCVEQCAKHVLAMTDLHTCQVRSLMACSFHVLKGSYSHCQESSSLYGDSLPVLSDTLSTIFRTGHSLQMVLLNLLDKLTTSPRPHCPQDVLDLAHVCQELFAVCRLVACLDLKLTISLWKALSKLAGQQTGVLHPHLDMSGMVSYLCTEIHTGVTQLLQSAPPAEPDEEQTLSQRDEKVFLKSLRILSFQMKVLVAMVRDFHDYLTDCVPGLHRLLLYLISVMPPCGTAVTLQDKHSRELQQQVGSAAQPLVNHLLTNTTFTRCLLDTTECDQKKGLACLLLQAMVMDTVAQASGEVVAQWLDTSSTFPDSGTAPNLLSAVLATLHSCHVEVCLPVYLPGPPCEGKPDRKMSVYQYVVEHVCAFIASCPAKLFHTVETSLLQALFSGKPVVSLAAADCWCFLARYGTAELCWHHTQLLLSVALRINSWALRCPPATPLTSLLRRLVKFLPPHHQRELVSRLAPSSHLALWSEIGVGVLSPAVATEACRTLLPTCLDALCDFCGARPHTLSQAASVISAMRCLHNAIQHSRLTPEQGALLLDVTSAMWRVMPPDLTFGQQSGGLGEVRQSFLSALVTLTSDLVDQMEVKLLLQVLVSAHKMLQGGASREVAAAIVCLLQSLGPLKLPPSVEQGQVLRKISELFACALSHEAACVQYASLEAFTRFAEQTAHEAVVPECLAQRPDLQDRVAAFLQKVPFPAECQFDVVSYLQNQHQQTISSMQAKEGFIQSEPAEASEPQSKRRRTENADDQHRSGVNEAGALSLLDDLEKVTQRMEELRADGTLPNWVMTRSQPLLQRLSVCLDHR